MRISAPAFGVSKSLEVLVWLADESGTDDGRFSRRTLGLALRFLQASGRPFSSAKCAYSSRSDSVTLPERPIDRGPLLSELGK